MKRSLVKLICVCFALSLTTGLFGVSPGYADHEVLEVIATVDVGVSPVGVGVNPFTDPHLRCQRL